VIAPPAPDLEVARRVAFSPEAESPDEPDRSAIAGLNVRFQAVKPKPPKRIVDHE
jgi:hypothetical protein